MERRKDTPGSGTKLPREYLDMVADIFNKNFGKQLKHAIPSKAPGATKKKGAKADSPREAFVVYGEIYPDELILSISLKCPEDDQLLRMTTCYSSIDYPPKGQKAQPASVSESVQACMNFCVDATASFFATYFDEGRPVDYDLEYRQNWTPVEIAKNSPTVFLRINHDNPELELQADKILAEADEAAAKAKKEKMH